MALISVVLSFRNEAPVLPELVARLDRAFGLAPVAYELVFVNDGSTDGSLEWLRARAASDPRIKVITMSRRFGPAECAIAGLRHARGDAVVIMDADLQDPPELLPVLIAKWQAGAEVVNTVRTRRHGESVAKMRLTQLAYRMIGVVSDVELREQAGDYKLLSRRAVTELLRLPESDPYLRGLVAWIGFRQEFVPYERAARFAGRTHFPFFSRNPWRSFLSGLTSFSVAPLLLFLPLGALAGTAGLLTAVWAALAGAGAPVWLAALMLALSGLQLSGLGVAGLYIARIYRDVRGRPAYIIDHTINLEPRVSASASLASTVSTERVG